MAIYVVDTKDSETRVCLIIVFVLVFLLLFVLSSALLIVATEAFYYGRIPTMCALGARCQF